MHMGSSFYPGALAVENGEKPPGSSGGQPTTGLGLGVQVGCGWVWAWPLRSRGAGWVCAV